jgi:hypothetical protein
LYPNYPPANHPYYGDPAPGYQGQPAAHPGQGGYGQPQAPEPRRRMAPSAISALGLAVALLLTFIGAVIVYVGENNTAKLATERANGLQQQLDAAKKAETELREKFKTERFEERFLKVKDADAAENRAYRTFINSSEADSSSTGSAWTGAVRTCLREVTAYNQAAAGYPKGWFGAAPATIDGNAEDTNCFSFTS